MWRKLLILPKITLIMVHAHSGLRWLVLIMLLVAIVNALIGWLGNKDWQKKDKMINMITMMFFHLQVVIGIVLYFISPKVTFTGLFDEGMRTAMFYSLEHPTMMLISAILFTIGYSKAKRADSDSQKFRRTFFWFLITLLIVLYSIPWSEAYGASMF